MTGIGMTVEALSIFLHLSENKHDTAWFGGMKVGLSKRMEDVRRRGMDGRAGPGASYMKGSLAWYRVKIKRENYESNRHSSASPTGDLPLYFLMNVCVFPQVVPTAPIPGCECCVCL